MGAKVLNGSLEVTIERNNALREAKQIRVPEGRLNLAHV